MNWFVLRMPESNTSKEKGSGDKRVFQIGHPLMPGSGGVTGRFWEYIMIKSGYLLLLFYHFFIDAFNKRFICFDLRVGNHPFGSGCHRFRCA